MKNWFSLLGAAILLAGCATPPPPDVLTHYDRLTGIRTDLIPDNFIETDHQTQELIWLNASRVFRNNRDFDYFLEVHYEALAETGLLDISPGPSLQITADGNEMELRSSGSMNARKHKGNIVSEDALYEVSPSQLRAIANAENVTVRITGRNGVVVRELTPANLQRFRSFVHHYVEGHG